MSLDYGNGDFLGLLRSLCTEEVLQKELKMSGR